MSGRKRTAAEAVDDASVPAKKTKIAKFVCRCDHEHMSEADYNIAREQFSRLEQIRTKVAPWSKKVAVFVGEGVEKQLFYVDQCLLKLHSGYFKDTLLHLEHDADQKLSLSNVHPAESADFVCWLSTGSFIIFDDDGTLYPDPNFVPEKLWTMGCLLRSPYFQTNMIDALRRHRSTAVWPDLAESKKIYKFAAKDSKLRKFAAYCLAYENPFNQLQDGSPEYAEWSKLFEETPDLGSDVTKAGAKKLKDKRPWSAVNRDLFVEEEPDIAQLWEEQILEGRDIEQVEREARNGCIQSKFELDHLNRDKD